MRKNSDTAASLGIATCIRTITRPLGARGQRITTGDEFTKITLPRVKSLDGNPKYQPAPSA